MVRTMVVAVCLAVLCLGEASALPGLVQVYGAIPALDIDKSKCAEAAGKNRVVCSVDVLIDDAANCNPEVSVPALHVHKASFGGARDRFFIVWTLKLRSGANVDGYSFAPATGIQVIQRPSNAEYFPLAISSNGDGDLASTLALPHHRVFVKSRSRLLPMPPTLYHYNVSILRKNSNDDWEQCGAIDPLIVNTD